ncbi:glycosyltransferase [Stappia sp. GBMRC 2046]|uniref:Glycosyltransferase n=1 Tax=Stappia sediminis TaxID=2692190 RepID=A0A7X3S8H4_9HYPH|nr:glycosyltransferase [Stappia sediminis]MXN65833.1 glycosyltransferase [Stappia sediminis]
MNPLLTAIQDGIGPGLVVFGCCLLILPWMRPEGRWRWLAVYAIIFLTLRYLHWRVTETLPSSADTEDFVFAVGFLAIEGLASIGSILTLITLSRVKDRTPFVDAALAEGRSDAVGGRERAPLVDVFICTFNEEREILERTIAGALGMDHENFRVWVLDDGRREWLADLCRDLGCLYLTRTDNAHAKAGNINHALARVANLPEPPEFVSILDADFVPTRAFLKRCLTLFRDGQVGIVQTPQHFINPDPIQSNLGAADVWPDEQRFFFDVLMPSKDAWGTAFCCGTSSVIRWQALEAAGGFPVTSITEDYLLTLRLKQHGYQTAYLNERLSLGLAPEGLNEYVTQRSRWCLGFMQILASRDGPLNPASGLGVVDRLALVESFLYWAGTYLFRFASLVVPIAYFLFDLKAIDVSLSDGISYFVPYFVGHVGVIGWLSGTRILPILTDVAQLLTMREVLLSVALGIVKPKGHKFAVTAKGGDRSKTVVQWRLIRFFGVMLAATLASIGYSFYADPNGPLQSSSVVALFWSWYNITVLLIAIACCVERPRMRKSERMRARGTVELLFGDRAADFQMLDISISGIRFAGNCGAAVGSTVNFRINGQDMSGRIVRNGKREFALEIDHTFASKLAMVREVYSGQFETRIERVRSFAVSKRVFARLFG